jgi:hypothetical protein
MKRRLRNQCREPQLNRQVIPRAILCIFVRTLIVSTFIRICQGYYNRRSPPTSLGSKRSGKGTDDYSSELIPIVNFSYAVIISYLRSFIFPWVALSAISISKSQPSTGGNWRHTSCKLSNFVVVAWMAKAHVRLRAYKRFPSLCNPSVTLGTKEDPAAGGTFVLATSKIVTGSRVGLRCRYTIDVLC